MTGKDRSADRHVTGNQVGIAARLDREEFDRLERLWPALGLPSRRQAIIRAIREFIERNENAARLLMPPRDPRLRPDLEVAMPADRKPGTTRVTDAPEPWSVQFGGEAKQWRDVHVVAWAMDNRGREIADVEWYIDGFAWNESFIAERSKMRKRW